MSYPPGNPFQPWSSGSGGGGTPGNPPNPFAGGSGTPWPPAPAPGSPFGGPAANPFNHPGPSGPTLLPPPKPPRRWGRLALIGGGALGAVIIVIAVLSVVLGNRAAEITTTPPPPPLQTTAPTPAASPSPTSATTPDPTPGTTPSRTPRPTTTPPSPQPTPTRPGERSRPDGVAYENEDYEVPAPPGSGPERVLFPLDTAQANAWTRSNATYGQRVANPVRCPYDPIWSLNDGHLTGPELESRVNRYVDCLMVSWQPAVENAGFTLTKPQVSYYRGQISTPCGTSPGYAAGFYCSANESIYVNESEYAHVRNDDGLITYQFENLLAHEFAHHVQARTGILGAYARLFHDSGDLEVNRRMELQANCYAGLGLSAHSVSFGMTDADRRAITAAEYRTGDQPGRDRTHGRPENFGRWFETGFTGDATPGRCNTFVAASDEVA
ncbi:neutral zinc metallopeptidase [Ammonicoccus fulvus]|uniref:Neutral zinc metallopeptidase n=1 Tax=Ammonicoccus fulvus TaxID=3138240 RepID=A0ABZ3FMH0_9ACTN